MRHRKGIAFRDERDAAGHALGADLVPLVDRSADSNRC